MSTGVLSCPEPRSKEGQIQEEGEGNGVSLGKAPLEEFMGATGWSQGGLALVDLSFTYLLCDVGQVTYPVWCSHPSPGCWHSTCRNSR